MSFWRAAVKEPLLHFVLLGAAVFLVDARLRHEAESVHVSAEVRRDIASRLERELSHAPTEAEVAQGVEEWVTTERLYREAKALGLDENDAVIREQLARKLKLIVKQRTIAPAPTDAELRAELAAHPERYTGPPTFEVTHAFVARAAAPEPLEQRAEAARKRLEAGEAPERVGDHFPRGPKFPALTQAQLEDVLGVKLSAALDPNRPGVWHVAFGQRGAHLLRLDAYQDGKPDFEALRSALARDVEERKQQAAVAAFLEELKGKYPLEDLAVP